MIGPWTSRAIARTASKSPGEAIGNPASMTSTPRRASCCAISSFSVVFSEMPGDCSPSRSVVSKMVTRFVSCMGSLLLGFVLLLLVIGMRLRGRHALFPPRGEEKVQVKSQRRHAGKLSPDVDAPPGRAGRRIAVRSLRHGERLDVGRGLGAV